MEPQHYWSMLKRRGIPAACVFSIVFALTLLNISLKKPIYEAQGKLRFKANSPSITGLAGENVAKLDSLVQTNNPLTTEMGVIRTVPIVAATIDQLQLKDTEGAALSYKDFLQRLKLVNEKGTDLLTVSYQDLKPDTAKIVVDTLMQTYLTHHLHQNRAQAVAALAFIEQQLPDAEASVQTAEANLRRFKEVNQVTVLDRESQEVVTGLETLRQQVIEVQSKLADAQAQAVALQQELALNPQEATVTATLNQSAGVQEVLKELQAVETQLSVERARLQDQSPIVQDLLDRQRNLESLLQTRIQQVAGRSAQLQQIQLGELKTDLIADFVAAEVRRAGLQQQAGVLSQAQTAYQQRIQTLPRLEQEQRELERKLNAAQSTYSLLLQRFHETRVAERQNLGNAQIIQPAYVADTPIAPRKLRLVLAGGLLGASLAGATIYLLETKDRSLRTIKDLREIFGYTVLVVIPFHHFMAKRSFLPIRSEAQTFELIVRDSPHSPVSETYRMLQTNLKFLRSDQPLRTIVVTSAVAHEGKSTVAANLAMAMAQSGQQVLLIDADMRSPRQHQLWDVLNREGLSNILVERINPIAAIKTVSKNLDLLPAGVSPPNPVTLLDSQRMNLLIEKLMVHYQFIIFDTPPLTTSADVAVLGKLSDGVLVVSRPGVVDVGSAGLAKERLEQSNQNVLGLVINGVTPEHELSNYYLREYQTEDLQSVPPHQKMTNV